ncbi:MAG TPA: hypothetical protein VGD62_06700, partial [Acidobacteriaceae bacterium]
LADGILLHAVLMGSTMLFLHGVIGPATLIAVQVLNAALFFVFRLGWREVARHFARGLCANGGTR